MHFIAHLLEKIIGVHQMPMLRPADMLASKQLVQRKDTVFEKSHPNQILIITQTPTTIFDFRFLHEGGIPIAMPTLLLITQPGGEEIIFMPTHFLRMVSRSRRKGAHAQQ